jgi:radical SAM superfamily enzyme YgiQ (UPF0313 family)
MRVLLANPPWLRPGWHGVRAGSRWPHLERSESPYSPFPFLMAYAAAVLEADGVEAVAVDACAERLERSEFLNRFNELRPDVAVFEVSTPSLHEDLRTVRAVRDELDFDGPILLAGLHKPLYDPAFLRGCGLVDGTLVGEYELTLRDFARAGAAPKEPIPGLIWRERRGNGAGGAAAASPAWQDAPLLDGSRKPSQQQLDRFPWPARHLFPMDRYHDLPGGIPAPSVQMWASRGCSFTCSFCAWPQILYADHLYRTRDPGKVADEMLAMQAQGYRSAYFDDDTFNLGKKRTTAIAEAFRARGVEMPWAFMGRADTCEPEQYDALAESGLRAVKYGVESADTARLKRIGKNLDVDRVRATVRAVQRLGIKVHLTFMFGLPGETLETMQRTLDLAYELDPDSAQFTVATPFPGSRLHEELSADGRLDGAVFEDLDGYRTGVVSTEALSAEQIVAFVHGVHRRWESRPRPAGPAPRIPVAEIGGAALAFGLLARAGEAEWLRAALQAVVAQEGPAREIVVVADRSDPALERAAAEVCDWATFVDAGPLDTAAAFANRVAPACTATWLATLRAPWLPGPGFLRAALDAGRLHGEAGALALPGQALAVSRWGRVLRWKGAGSNGAPLSQDGAREVFGAGSESGVFRRDLLEESKGWDEALPGELADADLALRARLLGWRALALDADGDRTAGPLLARFGDGEGDGEARPGAPPDRPRAPESGRESGAARAWARGRLRMLLRSLPREAWEEAPLPLVLELAADLYRAGRDGGRPGALLLGFADALRESRELLASRKQFLGRRRVGPEFLRTAFLQSETDMRSCAWQRVQQAAAAR